MFSPVPLSSVSFLLSSVISFPSPAGVGKWLPLTEPGSNKGLKTGFFLPKHRQVFDQRGPSFHCFSSASNIVGASLRTKNALLTVALTSETHFSTPEKVELILRPSSNACGLRRMFTLSLRMRFESRAFKQCDSELDSATFCYTS